MPSSLGTVESLHLCCRNVLPNHHMQISIVTYVLRQKRITGVNFKSSLRVAKGSIYSLWPWRFSNDFKKVLVLFPFPGSSWRRNIICKFITSASYLNNEKRQGNRGRRRRLYAINECAVWGVLKALLVSRVFALNDSKLQRRKPTAAIVALDHRVDNGTVLSRVRYWEC